MLLTFRNQQKSEDKAGDFIRMLRYLNRRRFAAEGAEQDLEFSLGRFFDEKSQQSSTDVQLAAKLYKKAADANHPMAAYNYAILLRRPGNPQKL